MSLPEPVRFLVQAAMAAPSADNTQPWSFEWDGNSLVLVSRRFPPGALTFAPDHPAVQLALGAAWENLLQAAAQTGYAELHPVINEGGSDMIGKINVKPGGLKSPPPISLFGRHTNRLPYRLDPAPSATLEKLSALTEGEARCVVWSDRETVGQLAELTRRASEVRFQTKEIHEWLVASLRFSPAEVARGDGLDIATLDLPPGGRYLLRLISDWGRMSVLNRLGAYKAFARLEAQPMARAPAVVAILGGADRDGARAAGRLMERIWIDLNQQGLAVQPYYVIPDQMQRLAAGRVPAPFAPLITQVADAVGDMLDLGQQAVHMLLRVGWPTRSVQRSRRLPPESMIRIST